MALPLLIKLYWAGKVLKYPFVALVSTVREYRRRESHRVPAAHDGPAPRIAVRYRERNFFHSPGRAICDRRFWIRGVTNFAEMLLHILSLAAWVRNALLRLTCRSFIVWNPYRTHEQHLFDEVEYAGWGRVLRRSACWAFEGLRLRYGPPRPTITAAAHGRRRHWREVHFDQTDVAVYVGPRPWRRPIIERRSRSGERILRLHSVGPRRVRAVLIAASGEVLQTITLGPTTA